MKVGRMVKFQPHKQIQQEDKNWASMIKQIKKMFLKNKRFLCNSEFTQLKV